MTPCEYPQRICSIGSSDCAFKQIVDQVRNRPPSARFGKANDAYYDCMTAQQQVVDGLVCIETKARRELKRRSTSPEKERRKAKDDETRNIKRVGSNYHVRITRRINGKPILFFGGSHKTLKEAQEARDKLLEEIENAKGR